mmetsp:Transcript_62973/g.204100  ORF Transcript_62973/g.204100 Transcript_62973/m.204100 type:complete len:110 (-) Transcript_62973:441-770(-)
MGIPVQGPRDPRINNFAPSPEGLALNAADDEALAAYYASLRVLVPADADAREQVPCAEIATVLGMHEGGRAVLVVRPDGYIAVSQLGSWAAEPVTAALEELGYVVCPCE